MSVLRLDLKYTRYSGNKDYKLRYIDFTGISHVVSFGGAWSNHLLALSRLAADKNLALTAYVRSYTQQTTPILDACVDAGMEIRWCQPQAYRHRNQPNWLNTLRVRHPNSLILPEGGVSAEALRGCCDIGTDLLDAKSNASHIVLAVGTGQTMAGVCLGVANAGVKLVVEGEATTKRYDEQALLIEQALGQSERVTWELFHHQNLGRYGQLKPELVTFIHWFEASFGIPLEPNYSAKAFYGFFQRLQQGHYPVGANVVLIHTGGLLGRAGYPALN